MFVKKTIIFFMCFPAFYVSFTKSASWLKFVLAVVGYKSSIPAERPTFFNFFHMDEFIHNLRFQKKKKKKKKMEIYFIIMMQYFIEI